MILAVDQGTHATRAILFDGSGAIRASAFVEVSLHRVAPGMVEQDAEEIARSVEEAVRSVLASDAGKAGVSTAGMATQRSSVVAWDMGTGEPLAPMLSWQDRRAAQWLEGLREHETRIRAATGLPLSPHYGASKLRWLLYHVPAVRRALDEGRLAMGPLAAFLLFRMSRGRVLAVDHANASRTQLWNLATRGWDPWLLGLFGVPRKVLPDVRPIVWNYEAIADTGIPLAAVNGDQNAAVYALGRPTPGTAIVNLGTGAFVLVPTGDRLARHQRLLSSIVGSWPDRSEYTIEGTVNGAGAALAWAEERWGIRNIVRRLPAWLEEVKDPPVFLNAVGGLGSPWWESGLEPRLIGDGTEAQRAVAVAESVLFMLRANLDEMRQAGVTVERIQVSGGLSRMDAICQRLADLTGMPVRRPPETEATGRGIAWLASGASGPWPVPSESDTFVPRADQGLEERYGRFLEAVERSIGKAGTV